MTTTPAASSSKARNDHELPSQLAISRAMAKSQSGPEQQPQPRPLAIREWAALQEQQPE